MLPFSLNNEQLDDLVPRLCLAIDQYFGTSRIHRFPDRIAFLLRPDCGMAYANMFGPKLSCEIGSISLPASLHELPPPDASEEFENAHAVSHAVYEGLHSTRIDELSTLFSTHWNSSSITHLQSRL